MPCPMGYLVQIQIILDSSENMHKKKHSEERFFIFIPYSG